METEIVELLKEIRDELKKLTAQVSTAQNRDYQRDAEQVVSTIMSAVTKGMGGNHGQ